MLYHGHIIWLLADYRTIAVHDRGDQNSHLNPNHDVFLHPNHVLFTPKPNQSFSTALWRERNRKFNLNKRKAATQRNIRFELICGFTETYSVLGTIRKMISHKNILAFLLLPALLYVHLSLTLSAVWLVVDPTRLFSLTVEMTMNPKQWSRRPETTNRKALKGFQLWGTSESGHNLMWDCHCRRPLLHHRQSFNQLWI